MSHLFKTPESDPTQETIAATTSGKAPDSWESIGSKVPKYFRAPLIERAWKTHAETLEKLKSNETFARTFIHITAESTAMADINAAIFMPLHLVKESQREEALATLSNGVGDLSVWLKNKYPTADVVLIVGDQPNEETLVEQLDTIFESSPAKRLVCGPGASVEKMVRNFGETRNYGAAQICSIDERGGSGWTQTPGPKLEKMIDDLLRQHQPARIVAFEPLQMPATHQMVEKAEKLGIPVMRVDAPSVKSRFQPT